MSIPTVALSIVSAAITGAPLANGSVILQLTAQDILTGTGGAIVPATPVTVPLDANGLATTNSFPNVLGAMGTQTKVTLCDSTGAEVGYGLATIPNYACNLHDVMDLAPPPNLTSAQAGANLSRAWAMQPTTPVDGTDFSAKEMAQGSAAGTGGSAKSWALTEGEDVPGAAAGSRSAKSWAQEDLIGTEYGGSAKDWAQGAGLIDGSNKSAKGYASDSGGSAAAAATSQAAAAASQSQTGLDRAQCDADAAAASGSATIAQGFQLTAVAAASLAMAMAAAAASVAQQDLSGTTGSPLFRTPNNILALAHCDTTKDPDGGAWTQRAENLSYYTETLSGAWIPATSPDGYQSELDARCYNATLGTEVCADPTFSGTSGWTLNGSASIAGNTLTMSSVATGADIASRTDPVGGALVLATAYQVTIVVATLTAGALLLRLGNTVNNLRTLAAPGTYVFTVNPGAAGSNLGLYASGTTSGTITKFSIKPVTAQTTSTGAFFNKATDGNTYSLSAGSGITLVYRGSKARPFRYGIAVGESAALTVFDALEPGRPMWMRFVANVANNAIPGTISFVQYASGSLWVGTSAGLVQIDLAGDRAFLWSTAGLSRYRGKIADRNAGLGWDVVDSTKAIASITVNAVAVTTMPDAPCDPATGLQVPTVALGTAGGASVIQNNGTVVNSAATNNFGNVSLNPYLVSAVSAGSTTWTYALNPKALGASFASTNLIAGSAPGFNSVGSIISGAMVGGRGMVYARVGSQIHWMRFNEANPAASLAGVIDPNFSTGGWIGDIRRAALCDTSSAVGSLAAATPVNDTFDADVGVWTGISGGTATWDAGGGNGRMLITRGSTTSGAIRSFATVAGQDYAVSLTGAIGTATGLNVYVGSTSAANDLLQGLAIAGANTFTFRAVGATTYLYLPPASGTTGATFYVDNVLVQAVVADRSYKGRPLTVFGTGLARAQVATGSQLVALSGFSNTSYLQEAGWSAGLDPATGALRTALYGSLPATLVGSATPAPGGVGPAVTYLPLGNFPLTNLASLAMNTSQWTNGTGWTCPAANSFSCDGSQGAAQSDLLWGDAVTRTPATGVVRKWTLTITALNLNGGTLTVYPNSQVPFNILAPGTYTGLGDFGSTAKIRVSGGTGATCTGTLQVDELAPAYALDRGYSAGAYYRDGCTALGALFAELFDGTTVRNVCSVSASAGGTYYATGQRFKAAAQYDTSGTLTLLVNGQPVASTPGNPLLTLNNASAVLTVGNRYALDAAWPGDLALVKIGMTVPTQDGSTWMYEQEKEMFAPGAQVTLPDSGSVVDMDWDDSQGKLKVVSAANESSFVGMVRTATSPVAAGSYTHVAHRSGIKAVARSTTNPGVDITMPALNLQEQLNRREEVFARRVAANEEFDWTPTFTVNITNGLAQATVTGSSLVYPAGAPPIGALVTGAGIQAGTKILGISGTTVNLSLPCTATASGVTVSFLSFPLPTNYETRSFFGSTGLKREGNGFDYQRQYDGFREAPVFTSGQTGFVRISARRIAA